MLHQQAWGRAGPRAHVTERRTKRYDVEANPRPRERSSHVLGAATPGARPRRRNLHLGQGVRSPRLCQRQRACKGTNQDTTRWRTTKGTLVQTLTATASRHFTTHSASRKRGPASAPPGAASLALEGRAGTSLLSGPVTSARSHLTGHRPACPIRLSPVNARQPSDLRHPKTCFATNCKTSQPSIKV